ncbi:cytochrome b [Bradyrhizobium sp. WD16]|uniref:cytochrome b n=1 Tax=Bradyrhizobium sp. WD16 TaxID=1521768 RepID=UPI0020A5BA03|nr:cytochrome b [Bradyrhizobium sp. WD16]UTD28214.1 cytochrome B [Bradyrhizobium sp. WD16]
MDERLHYGAIAKALHWLIVLLLAIQYPIGWLMPDIHRGMQPGWPMNLHVSLGIVILVLILLRFAWRMTHPVAPESSLPSWQRLMSEGVHWLLYLLVFVTTISGWMFASMRGWNLSFFGLVQLPMLTAPGASLAKAIGPAHEILELALISVIGVHVAAALVHIFVYRDRIMQRMLPG